MNPNLLPITVLYVVIGIGVASSAAQFIIEVIDPSSYRLFFKAFAKCSPLILFWLPCALLLAACGVLLGIIAGVFGL